MYPVTSGFNSAANFQNLPSITKPTFGAGGAGKMVGGAAIAVGGNNVVRTGKPAIESFTQAYHAAGDLLSTSPRASALGDIWNAVSAGGVSVSAFVVGAVFVGWGVLKVLGKR